MKKNFFIPLLALLLSISATAEDNGGRRSGRGTRVKTAKTTNGFNNKRGSANKAGKGATSWERLIRALPAVPETVTANDVTLGMKKAEKISDNIAYRLASEKCPGNYNVSAIKYLGEEFEKYIDNSPRYETIGHMASKGVELKCRYQYYYEFYLLSVISQRVFGPSRATLPEYAESLFELQHAFSDLVIDWTTMQTGPASSHSYDDLMVVLEITKGACRMLNSDYYVLKDPDLAGYCGNAGQMMEKLLSKFDYDELDPTSASRYMSETEFENKIRDCQEAWNTFLSQREAWIATLPLEKQQIAVSFNDAFMVLEWTNKLRL